jgi:hypothetical protein
MVHAKVIKLEEKRNEIFAQMDSLSQRKREHKSLQVGWSEEDYRHELEETRILREAAVTKAHVIDAARKEAANADGRATRAKQAVEDRASLITEVEAIEAKIKALDDERIGAKNSVDEAKANVANSCELMGKRPADSNALEMR